METATAREHIAAQIARSDVVLFMKGTPESPQCGFSAVNVLDDEAIRQGVKDFSNWPTIPQLYVKGELVGGCDIVREMHQSASSRLSCKTRAWRSGNSDGDAQALK